MSSFSCEKCGSIISDTTEGYVTECEHYPVETYKTEPSITDFIAMWDNGYGREGK